MLYNRNQKKMTLAKLSSYSVMRFVTSPYENLKTEICRISRCLTLYYNLKRAKIKYLYLNVNI